MPSLRFPPGYVVVNTARVSRYAEFWFCMERLLVPEGTTKDVIYGINNARQLNIAIRKMPAEAQWVFILDDDHVFGADILIRLLRHIRLNVDIVCAMYLQRGEPFDPLVYSGRDDGFKRLGWGPIHAQGRGLIAVDGTGNGGMLLSRRVLAAVGDPWFEVGKTQTDLGGKDLWFSYKAKQKGFTTYMDTETRMGHITHCAVWPNVDRDGNWSVQIRTPDDLPEQEDDWAVMNCEQDRKTGEAQMLAETYGAMHNPAMVAEYLASLTNGHAPEEKA